MTTPNNKFTKIGFKYDAARGTKPITSVAHTIYSWGEFIEDNITFPTLEAVVKAFHAYSSREVNVSTSKLIVPTIEIPAFIPSNMQWLYHFLGKFNNGAPDTLEALDSGLKTSATLHFEEESGTNEEVYDCVSSICTDVDFSLILGEPLQVNKLKYEAQSIESIDYYVTDASVSLTAEPTVPQAGLPFIGIDEFYWDTGGDNEELTNVARVDIIGHQNFKASIYNHTNKRRSVYESKYDLYTMNIYVVLDTKNQINDLLNQNKINCSCKSLKADGSDYVQFLMTGVHNIKVGKSAIDLGGGYYQSVITCQFEKLSCPFDDGTTDQNNEYA